MPDENKKYWFASMICNGHYQTEPIYNDSVFDTHPFIKVAEWNNIPDTTQTTTILYYKEITYYEYNLYKKANDL